MSSSSFLPLLILLSLSSPFFTNFTDGTEALIESICNATTYPDLCVATVNSDPSWTTADVRGMARIVTKRAINETLLTFQYISSDNATSTSEDGDYYVVVKECVTDYASANVSLQDAMRTLKAEPFLSARAVEDVELAEEAFAGCRGAFGEVAAGPAMLPAMQERIEQLCVVILGIVDQLTGVTDVVGLYNVKHVSY